MCVETTVQEKGFFKARPRRSKHQFVAGFTVKKKKFQTDKPLRYVFNEVLSIVSQSRLTNYYVTKL